MLRYERLTPAKQEVLGVDDWREWRLPAGAAALRPARAEAFFVHDGVLRICASGEAPVALGAGDWFLLEADAAYAVRVARAVFGGRQEAAG